MNRFLWSVAAGVTALAAVASPIDFTYDVDDGLPVGYGTGKPDTYEVCIRIDHPLLVGSRVQGLTVAIPAGGTVSSEAAGWVVSALPDEQISESNASAYAAGTISDDMLTVTFPKPITISNEGVYVGYTVTSESLINYSRTFPLATVEGDQDGSLYMRAASRAKWDNVAERMEQMSAMHVQLDGDLPSSMVDVAMPESFMIVRASAGEMPIRIINRSSQEVHSIDYEIYTAESTFTGHYDITPAVASTFGAYADVRLPLTGASDNGPSTALISILKVNGEATVSTQEMAETEMFTVPAIPKYRPLIEEYTGLWCGQCPAGWVALEEANDALGRDFVAISYHVNDVIQSHINPPHNAKAVPVVYMNRGISSSSGTLLRDYIEEAANSTDVALNINIAWTDQSRSQLKATATANFVRDIHSAGYRMCMALIADGMSDSSWAQTNYYSGQMNGGKYWEIFTYGGAYVYGLEYNDIALLFPYPMGEPGSLPNSVEAYTDYTYETTFTPAEATSYATGRRLVQDPGKLRVIALVVDSRGNVINSVSSEHSADAPLVPAGVESVGEDGEVVAEQWYTLQGLAVDEPAPGAVYIRVRTMNSGLRRADRIVCRR